ncbi:hypothetical protein K2173_021359 [Erythroxylum novogranatense]|uniref:OTU domain-containing protein n=1 Tax=Erythroxylum novogranatense TaxID=1862640 RepID=A0AAV8TUR0_9ROSI|nr:hypothetical protein K2173_021359 [Erythroxylum novogranatense]
MLLQMVTAFSACRALADQLDGNEEEHAKYRNMVVQYISKNRQMFEPFIEDDIPFDEYCRSMEKDGTWAGHMELQAASLVLRSNICIHRSMFPRWYIRNFDQCGIRMIHLSYHDGEHYNSVRLREDPGDGPARPITIKADADLSATSHQAKDATSKSKGRSAKDVTHAGSIKLVMAGSGCENTEKVEEILMQVDGDVEAAIEYLIAEQDADDCSAQTVSISGQTDAIHECQEETEDANNEPHEEEPIKANDHDLLNKNINDSSSSHVDDEKVPRNKVCPCGSRKKHKACCGAAKARASNKFVVNQSFDSRKSRKERKQSKRGAANSVLCSRSDGGLPDMGALCI